MAERLQSAKLLPLPLEETSDTNMTTENLSATVSATTGMGTAVAAGIGLGDFVMVTGLIFTIATFVVSLVFHIRRDRRETKRVEREILSIRQSDLRKRNGHV